MLPQQKPVFPWADGTHGLRKLGPTVGRHRSTTSAQKQTTKLDAESLPFFLSLLPGSRSSTSRHSHDRPLPVRPLTSHPLLRYHHTTRYFSPPLVPTVPTPSTTARNELKHKNPTRVHSATMGTDHRIVRRPPMEYGETHNTILRVRGEVLNDPK